jgi:hypothetical protein
MATRFASLILDRPFALARAKSKASGASRRAPISENYSDYSPNQCLGTLDPFSPCAKSPVNFSIFLLKVAVDDERCDNGTNVREETCMMDHGTLEKL